MRLLKKIHINAVEFTLQIDLKESGFVYTTSESFENS